jgi:hypothetical protein
MHLSRHVTCPLLSPDINQTVICRNILVYLRNTKFNSNIFSGSWFVTCGQTAKCNRFIFARFHDKRIRRYTILRSLLGGTAFHVKTKHIFSCTSCGRMKLEANFLFAHPSPTRSSSIKVKFLQFYWITIKSNIVFQNPTVYQLVKSVDNNGNSFGISININALQTEKGTKIFIPILDIISGIFPSYGPCGLGCGKI